MIHYSVSDSIAEIRIDHPPVNGLGVVMIDDLIAALGRAAAAADVRVVLITSAVPRRFCAGLDLKVVLNDVSALRSLVDKLYVRLSDAQQALGKPSIAVVNGAARQKICGNRATKYRFRCALSPRSARAERNFPLRL